MAFSVGRLASELRLMAALLFFVTLFTGAGVQNAIGIFVFTQALHNLAKWYEEN